MRQPDTDLNMIQLLERALEGRIPLMEEPHRTALRLFNGFYEGMPGLVVDLYATALVIYNHAAQPGHLDDSVRLCLDFYFSRLPWLEAGLVKVRRAEDPELRNGWLAFGDRLPKRIFENGVWYALDLRLNQDASFYLDTRVLRAWLKKRCNGLAVLNTFAYTGSLGTACAAGGAARVLQLDRNRRFLNLAKDSYALNGLAVSRSDFLAEDFFRFTARLRRSGEMFDLALIDPPYYSETGAGRVDLEEQFERLVNKVRPLLVDSGLLVVINNALYLSGKDFLAGLERLGSDGFLSLEEIVAVPEDVCGYPGSRAAEILVDPSPFNHSTKIAVLRVKRK
jgi:23S rRNA (cytosine1962-C5)-methyltransferase